MECDVLMSIEEVEKLLEGRPAVINRYHQLALAHIIEVTMGWRGPVSGGLEKCLGSLMPTGHE